MTRIMDVGRAPADAALSVPHGCLGNNDLGCRRVQVMNEALSQRLAVTVVENDHTDVEACTQALEEWRVGYQLARNVPDGIKLLRKQPTPILITDLHAPYENVPARLGGLNLLEQVRQDWPDTSVLMLADDDDLPHLNGCIEAGVERLLLKPLRRAELRLAIDSSLAAQERRHHRLQYQRKLERRVQRQSDRLRLRLNNALASLFMTLDIRDPITHAHSRRVKRYAALLVKALGLDSKQQKEITLGAKLHDIGKIGIDETILRKPGDLTADEIQAIQQHTLIGVNIIKPLLKQPRVLAAIMHHHERIDGRGYPHGLVGDAIPFEARVVSVVDCFDALTSLRPYRNQPMVTSHAIELMMRQTNGHLDPQFVNVFKKVLETQTGEIDAIRRMT